MIENLLLTLQKVFLLEAVVKVLEVLAISSPSEDMYIKRINQGLFGPRKMTVNVDMRAVYSDV